MFPFIDTPGFDEVRPDEVAAVIYAPDIHRSLCWPSTGQFISWCKDKENGAVRLPHENMLYDMVMRCSARRS
ncbi:replication protein P [Pantoea sp. KPR_PJ]|uniref:replication protein P n=1 Tax=Pantoea sp. KPR_PJ TaxID=2738375 RepID=UPI003528534D